MDTVTAVLDGQVVDLCQQQPLPASVLLTSPGKTYRTVATPDGRFRFFHIPSSTYLITTTCPELMVGLLRTQYTWALEMPQSLKLAWAVV